MRVTLSVAAFLAFCGAVWSASGKYEKLRSDIGANALAIAGKADKADIETLKNTVNRLELVAGRLEDSVHKAEVEAARRDGAR